MAATQRPQGARRARAARRELEAGATAQGWVLETAHRQAQGPIAAAGEREFPAHLSLQMLHPVRPERRISGDGFTLTTWRCTRPGAARLTSLPLRLQVLRLPSPGIEREIYFGRMPEAHRPILLPEVFRDRVALLPQAQVMAGGDIERVLAELEPLLGRIAAPRLGLVVWHGEVDLLCLEEPDTETLCEWITLGRDVVDALS